MDSLTQAERYLLDEIRRGKAEAWEQLVTRYQGRLTAFARSRSVKGADAEDLVQETFIQFLRSLPTFRQEASLETWLFMILRRRIVDLMRGRRVNLCALQESTSDDEPIEANLPAPDLSASTYARRDEQVEEERSALAGGLSEMIDNLKESENFRDLKIIEMLFYAQLRNKDIAKLMSMDEKAIALIKHRWLNSLRQRVATRLRAAELSALEGAAADSLLTEIWEDLRLSCPKRTTIGRFLLGTLEGPWLDYVDFHLNRLGCRFCKGNLEDLQSESRQQPAATRNRIYESTVGFLK